MSTLVSLFAYKIFSVFTKLLLRRLVLYSLIFYSHTCYLTPVFVHTDVNKLIYPQSQHLLSGSLVTWNKADRGK